MPKTFEWYALMYSHVVCSCLFNLYHLQGEVTQLLSDYRDLVLKHEALRLALEEHLPIQADPCSRGHSSDKVDTPASSSSARMAVTDAAGSLMQKLSLYSWKRDPPAAGQSTLLHSLFGRPSPSSDRPAPPPGLSPVISDDPTPHTTPSVHQSFLSERPNNNSIADEEPAHHDDAFQHENETAMVLTTAQTDGDASSDTRHQQAPTESLI